MTESSPVMRVSVAKLSSIRKGSFTVLNILLTNAKNDACIATISVAEFFIFLFFFNL